MGSLFLVELASFLSKTTQSTIVVDFNRDQQASAEGVLLCDIVDCPQHNRSTDTRN